MSAGSDMSARYASVDIGTNTAKLLVAEAREGVLQPLFQRAEATRVGRNVSVTGRISDEAFAALELVLRSFAQDVRDQGAVLAGAIATQAFRMASNGPELLEKVAAILGCEARTIAGPDEARLGWLAVANRHPSAELAVLDIGGGSTEATRKGRACRRPSGPWLCSKTADRMRRPAAPRPRKPSPGSRIGGRYAWAAVGGTATALAMLELGLTQYDAEAIEGLEVSLARITERIDSLARLTSAELLAIPGLGKGRADIVMPGLCILEAFLEQVHLDRVIISDRGIRYGLLVDWLRRRRAAGL